MKELALSVGNTHINVPGQINAIGNLSLSSVIQFAVSVLLFAAIVLSLIFLILGGLKWILSQGDKKNLEEAKKTVTYAIVGLLLVLLSFFIINFIGFAFNVSLLKQ